MLSITVVQPSYFMGEKPDENIAQFLLNELEKIEEGSLVVLPEYSNAGGISDPESEKAAMPRAKMMLQSDNTVDELIKVVLNSNVFHNYLLFL